jgi:cytochrome c oxidase accessory protein FixG
MQTIRRGLKQGLYALFALALAHVFISYFVSLPRLWKMMAASPAEHWSAFLFVIAMSAALWFDFAWFREQFCIVLCPYGRLQSVLMDNDTITVGYDAGRGEPRGRKGTPGAGDCVDCLRCVQVCPTGIDIRQGAQIECIACAACIDACDSVMEKIGSPPGLVRYATQAEIDGAPRRIFRPRIIVYSVILAAFTSGFAYAVTHRKAFDIDVLRDRNTLYRELDDGRIENVFTVRIINKDQRAHDFRLSALGLANAVVDSESPTQHVDAEDVMTVVVRVRIPPGQEHGGRDFTMVAQALDRPNSIATSRARFFSEP